MFKNIHKHFANVHLYITSRTYVHEQFTKYHELFAKVCELDGNFLQPTIYFKCNYNKYFRHNYKYFANR